MAWMQKLYETYESCSGSEVPGAKNLLPIAHTTQLAHIEIVIDGHGKFRRAQLVQKDDPAQPCVVPATEKSAGRTSGEAPHPLCDKIQYCAGDYKSFGGTKAGYFGSYLKQLSDWCASPSAHPKAQAVLAYVSGAHVVSDLVRAEVLVAPEKHLAVYEKEGGRGDKGDGGDMPGLFRLLTPKKEGGRSIIDQGDAFVRWRIELPGNVVSGTWEDRSLNLAWQQYEASQKNTLGFSMVRGRARDGEATVLATQHPAKLRHGADKAKLISSNDTSGFTFLGRFTDADQAAGVSFEVTQKAHNALRWLIGRQAFKNGDQVIVSWAVDGQPTPDLWANSMDLLAGDIPDVKAEPPGPIVGDVGQDYARRLNQAISGYRASLGDTADIVVMGLDSATTGRLAMTFYRELKASEFLDRIQAWHQTFSWPQNFGKNRTFVGAPAPRDIVEGAYGQRADDKLKKSTVERLIPCIVDSQALPLDLVRSCVRRASNRVGFDEWWEWEKCLGIACALFRGFHTTRGYSMTLEEDRRTRDYLYGRLLAVAEEIESRALWVADEKRDTTASRLMQRFADRPYSTWRNIELALTPYKSRLRVKQGAFLWRMERLLDEIQGSFSKEEGKDSFTNDRPLSGEFLLSYHCQRRALHTKADEGETTEPTVAATSE